MTDLEIRSSMAEVDPDLVKRLAELVDGDSWEIADLLAEKFPVEEYGEVSSGPSSDLYKALDAASDALRRDHGVDLASSSMRVYRATAIGWPTDTRVSVASFTAHRYLLGDDRHMLMDRYLKRNKGRPLSARDVLRYRSDDNPKPPKPWDVTARQRIESTARSLVLGAIVTKRDDWWNVEGVDESREAVQAMLYDLANRMGES